MIVEKVLLLGKKNLSVDYAADSKNLRFGVVGVKVWFYTKSNRPHGYCFTFSFNPRESEKNLLTRSEKFNISSINP